MFIIEVCLSQLTDDLRDCLRELTSLFEVDIVEYDCLSFCRICGQNLFVLVNGEVVTGLTVDELRTNIALALTAGE